MSKLSDKWKSLSVRYALVTVVLTVCIAGTLFWAYQQYTIEKVYAEQVMDHAKTIERDNHQLRKLLLRAEHARSSFLISPTSEAESSITSTLKLALGHANSMMQSHLPGADHIIDDETESIYANIVRRIQILLDISDGLKEVRLDREQMFPAMTHIVDEMYPANMQFNTALELLINEAEGVADHEKLLGLKDLQKLWITMISEFRVFMAFRTGTFGRPEVGMPVYSRNVSLIHSEVGEKLEMLKLLFDDDVLGFTAESAYEEMSQAEKQWWNVFERVREIQASNLWRMDTVIVNERIRPVSRSIYEDMSRLDEVAVRTYQASLLDFNRATTRAGLISLFVPLLVVVFMVLGFTYFMRHIIKPIQRMSRTMRDEAYSDMPDSFSGYSSDASEIADLYHAFETMNRRIHAREDHLEYIVHHDTMTGLPNREYMRNRMQELISLPNMTFAFLLVGVDRFKEINDCYGYEFGDQILNQISDKLLAEYQDTAFIARLGSDEYGLLLEASDKAAARKLATNIHARLRLPIQTKTHLLSISVSIGISLYPDHGDSVDTIMSRAVTALQVAKHDHSVVSVYRKDRDQNSEARLQLIEELRYAIEHNLLKMEYQPQISLHDGKVAGFEVLTRIPSLQHHNVGTQELIELAEQTGLIHQLTECVLQSVFEYCSSWTKDREHLSIGVNLSMANFHNPSLVDVIKAGLSSWNLPGNNLKLEITESVMMSDPKLTRKMLSEFDAMGVKLSVDDFGTGYSSFSSLAEMPVDELKIDKSFIASMLTSDKHRAIVKTIIDIADNLGIGVVAEGVETLEQYNVIKEMGCYAAQGYYISRSIPEGDVKDWLDTGKWHSSGVIKMPKLN